MKLRIIGILFSDKYNLVLSTEKGELVLALLLVYLCYF